MDSQTKKALRNIILLQCAGVPASMLFENGFLLTYLSLLGFSSATVLRLLSLQNLLVFPALLPAAILSDRIGKKAVGIPGLLATVAGFALITAAGRDPAGLAKPIVTAGIIVFGIGWAMFVSNWFALLGPIVPKENRSLSTALATVLQLGGIALSGLILAKVLDLGLLSESWTFLGKAMSEYDAILGGCGLSILLLTVTLGLVPSIISGNETLEDSSL